MLKFIGKGSAFNTSLGNNCAYILNDKNLLLIDCGSGTFSDLQKSGLLEGLDSIIVLMTHTHPDHIGSLGDLIFYGYYSMGELFKPSVTVVTPPEVNAVKALLSMGVYRNTYNLHVLKERNLFISKIGVMIEPVKVNHVKELKSFGYIIYHKEEIAYYSGDCYEIPSHILAVLNDGKFDYFYQDTCKADYEGNVHLSLRKLTELVDEEQRKRVYCMHLDNGFSEDEAKSLGFNVVSTIFESKK